MSETIIDLSDCKCSKKRKAESQSKIYELEIMDSLPLARNVIILGGKK